MKRNHFMFCLVVLVMSLPAGAQTFEGRATLSGEVLAASCSLSLPDRYQTVDMGDVVLRDVMSGNFRREREVVMRLENCSLYGTPEKTFSRDPAVRVRFDGVRGNQPHVFRTGGQGGGLGLVLRDAYDNRVIPGEYLPALHQGNRQEPVLKYRLSLVPDGVMPEGGRYNATLQVGIAYE